MRGIANYFSVSTEYKDAIDIAFPTGSLLFHGASHEERSQLSTEFAIKHPHVQIVFIDEFDTQEIIFHYPTFDKRASLRSLHDADEFMNDMEGNHIYIDITGLTHSVWAWMVRAMLLRKKGNFFVLYSEPTEYKFHQAPFDGQIFDLSEKISGIAPLPGLARLTRYTSDGFIFMPLLGFEGARLAHIFEDVQPSREYTFPVIGVPGFRHDFPFFAYQGNKLTLERESIWKNWRYEKANCPSSIYILGKDILTNFPDKELRIAPIGTKPHALGAVLLKLIYPTRVDIIYDHPIRKSGRTKGKSKTLCYRLNPFTEIISRK